MKYVVVRIVLLVPMDVGVGTWVVNGLGETVEI